MLSDGATRYRVDVQYLDGVGDGPASALDVVADPRMPLLTADTMDDVGDLQ